MFDRFTENARDFFSKAGDIARQGQHAYIGTEHMLMALLTYGDCGARAILDEFDFDEGGLRNGLEERLGAVPKTDEPTQGQLPFTPEAKDALANANTYSRSREDGVIGTEHLLYGLAAPEIERPGQSPARTLLEAHGLTAEGITLAFDALLSQQDRVADFHLYDALYGVRVDQEPPEDWDDDMAPDHVVVDYLDRGLVAMPVAVRRDEGKAAALYIGIPVEGRHEVAKNGIPLPATHMVLPEEMYDPDKRAALVRKLESAGITEEQVGGPLEEHLKLYRSM